MPRLSKHQKSRTSGMLLAGMRFTDIGNSLIAILQLYRSSEIVTRLLGR